MIKVEYKSNNSGARWWLSDDDWQKLEAAGWNIDWVKDQKVYKDTPSLMCGDENDRWLGALAKNASKEFETFPEAIREFEKVTGQNVASEGCGCCGAPHCFNWAVEDQNYYASGEEILQYIYGNDKPKTLREALEELEKLKK